MANDITLKSKTGVSKYPKTYSRNILDKDTTPTESSTNVVTSGGVYTQLNYKYTKPSTGIPKSDLASDVTGTISSGSTGFVTGGDVYTAIGNIESLLSAI